AAVAACERVFAPWMDLEEKMRSEKIPLFSLESKAPVKDFDIVAFSVNYELNYTNLLNMLDLSGIPLRANQRAEDHPLVIAGGPCTVNTAPLEAFIDAFVIGDGEEVILEIVDAYKKVAGCRPVPVCAANGGPGLPVASYVPKFPKEIKRRIVKDLDNAFYPVKEPVPYIQIIHDRITLEIMRGCPFDCKFCQTSRLYRPVRMRSRKKILELAKEMYRNSGYEEISLLSLSTASYPGIAALITELTEGFKEKGVGISIPSLRSKDVLKTLPSMIAQVRKAGLTFAVESGSERLRKYIGKDIDMEEVILACDEAFKSGWRLVKFYFMIGLPTETKKDLEGIPVFINRVLALKSGTEVSVSLNAFVPKAGTPFENEPMDSLDSLFEKQQFLKKALPRRRVNMKFSDPKRGLLEWRFNKNNKALSDVLYAAWKNGAKFDSWRECFRFDIWEDAFRQSGVD
ncbi:MAG: radical SAM protein, partial [Candidatus Omnitrophica bacterium]|nr:radical SAM protein [Candidatus Omnitrophota bacterium]